jgi:hypothetical protein
MYLALRDLEVDAVKGDDLAEGFSDPTGPNGKRFMPPIFGGCTRYPAHLGLGNRWAGSCTFG